MPPRRCLDCPNLIPTGSRCPRCLRAFNRRRTARRRAAGASGPQWQAIRALVLNEETRCYLCGIHQEEAARRNIAFTVDHVIPIKKGGTTTRANLRACCRPCNSRRRAHLRYGGRGTP